MSVTTETARARAPVSGASKAAFDRADHDAWVERVLGYSVPINDAFTEANILGGKDVKIDAVAERVELRGQPAMMGIGRADARLGKKARPGSPDPQAQPLFQGTGAYGRPLQVLKGPGDTVVFRAPPPPLGEITFSGGGGKGAALPGAVEALQPELHNVSVVKGASVGAMTAALVAAGVDPKEFKRISDDPRTSQQILKGKGMNRVLASGVPARVFGGNAGVDGDGLQAIVREEMNKAIGAQIQSFQESGAVATVDPAEWAKVEAIVAKMAKGNGVTFGDMRTLHGVIPAIKEVDVAATMIGDNVGKDGPTKKTKKQGGPQALMFNADTFPDIEVALACRASAALPGAFNPVEIELGGGIKGRFIDGGVMNNAPASNTVQAERNLDPMANSSRLTFVFEDEEGYAKKLEEGKATPRRSKMNDFISRAPNSAAEYGKERLLADSPDDIVVVPLKFQGAQKDYSTFGGGTVNFDIDGPDKATLQQMSKAETEAHLQKSAEPKMRQFASVKQMLNCITRDDLVELAKQGFDGAQEELEFRDEAAAIATQLASMRPASGVEGVDGPVKDLLLDLERLAQSDPDRLGFVAREMNRTGGLDPLLKAAAKKGDFEMAVVKAGAAVAEAVEAQNHAQNVLRYVIYPKLVKEKPEKAKAAVLRQADGMLRAARTPQDVNDALDLVIKEYGFTKKGKAKRNKFAALCREYKIAA